MSAVMEAVLEEHEIFIPSCPKAHALAQLEPAHFQPAQLAAVRQAIADAPDDITLEELRLRICAVRLASFRHPRRHV